ncbi:hypothetical protein BJ165DRAFT_1487538 [Panaeolus papilionaceus]|nr:hypothetical protein BJ165DRAFT_1487538 [Panaeolus papilionaceus]
MSVSPFLRLSTLWSRSRLDRTHVSLCFHFITHSSSHSYFFQLLPIFTFISSHNIASSLHLLLIFTLRSTILVQVFTPAFSFHSFFPIHMSFLFTTPSLRPFLAYSLTRLRS